MHRPLWWTLLILSPVACSPEMESASAAGLPVDTVDAQPLALIGELDGDPDYLFGDVASVAIGPDSVVYVADGIGANVRAFDLSGRYLGTVGSRGEGPGEFQFPNDVTFDPDGNLYVRERYRVTVFGSRSGGEYRDSLVRTTQLARPTLERARAKTDGERYYSPSYYYYMFVTHRYFYEVLDPTGPTGDTISVPALPAPELLGRANYFPFEGADFAVPVEGVTLAPFEPRPHWDLTPDGRVLMTAGRDYEVFEVAETGDTVRVLNPVTTPAPIPGTERQDSAVAFQARLDSIPVPISQVRNMSDLARDRELPQSLPQIIGLYVTGVGDIWVQRWPVDGQAIFDVYRSSGDPRFTVRLPTSLVPDTPPYVLDGLLAAAIRDPMTAVERVVVYTIPDS